MSEARKIPFGGNSERPPLLKVIEYATPLIKDAIRTHAKSCPKEIKEEMLQAGILRIIRHYQTMDPAKGISSYVFHHARGAVLDFLRSEYGDGDLEEQSDGNDQLFQSFGESLDIKWDLLSRLASQDRELEAFARAIRGMSFENIALCLGVKKTRAWQLAKSYGEKLNDPKLRCQAWHRQVCYSLGLSLQLMLPNNDEGIGWTLPSINLDEVTIHSNRDESDRQGSFFD